MSDQPLFADHTCHRLQAASLFKTVWALLGNPRRTPDQDLELLLTAHAYEHHACLLDDRESPVRAALLLARVHLAVGKPRPALEDARTAVKRCRGVAVCGCLRVEAHLAAARAAHAAGLVVDAEHHQHLAALGIGALPEDTSRQRLARELAVITGTA